MKYLSIILFMFCKAILFSQSVLEYNIDIPIKFYVYKEGENKLRKANNINEFYLNTPEELVKSYFFGTSNKILSSLYFHSDQFMPKDDLHFKNVIKTPSEDMYVQLLHKTNYEFEQREMCYIMFIARIKGVDFPFPTLLSLIRKGNEWLIYKRSNQQKLTDCLMMFKPCVLSNLFSGKSNNNIITSLIAKTKSKTNSLDFIKLFDELVIIQNDENLSNELTMSQNLDCTTINYDNKVDGLALITNLYQDVSIEKIKQDDVDFLMSKINKGKDSIVFKNKLTFENSNMNYIGLKFNRIDKKSMKISKDFIRLDNTVNISSQANQLFYIFKNFDTSIFSDLSPNLNPTSKMNSILYKKTRGVYEVLNVSKLYDLYQEEQELLDSYIE